MSSFAGGGKSGGKRKNEGDGSKTTKREKDDAVKMDADQADEDEDLVFADPYEDEFEEEEQEQDEDDEDDEEEDGDEEDQKEGANGSGAAAGGSRRQKQQQNDADEDDEEHAPRQVWRPGIDTLEDGETLEYDPSAYIMYHQIGVEWPCLTFDILRDTLGDARARFPHTMFLATGSQADRADANKITLLKLTELHKTYVEEEDEGEEEDLDEDPVLDHVNIPHKGGINRLRSCPYSPGLLASMADDGKAHIYDCSTALNGLMNNTGTGPPPKKPAYSFSRHTQEGYALDWSPTVNSGRLATGDCAGHIHVWQMGANSSSWTVDPASYSGHRGSVEDIQWSPTEATVFISCSIDKSFKIWDIRAKTAQITVDAHLEDINVMSWSRAQSYLLASGCDDGSFKVWDLRAVRDAKPLAHFTYHKDAVTSIDWAPHDESVLAVSSADNQLTIWDLSVEADDESASAAAAADPSADLSLYPPQLLFIHQGQQNIKEIHHHPHIPGVLVSTAEDGFNVFKPAITVQN